MKKIYIILIAILSIILIIFLGWSLLIRNPEIPLGEKIVNISPFGSAPTPSGVGVPTSGSAGASEESPSFDEFGSPTANLFRISHSPVAGMVVLKKDTGAAVRYVDRATGHIYDVDLTTLAKTKITNQTLPKIYEAYFRSNGGAVLLRSLKDDSDVIENLTLTLSPPKATSSDALHTVSATPLRGNINAIAVGTGNTIFYSLRDTSSIVSSTFANTNIKTLFSSPFTDWRLSATGNNLVIYTKASAGASGFAYTLNTSSGTLTKILGPLDGLVVSSNILGNRVLYSYSENNKTRTFAKNLTNNTQTEILPTTLAEKCIWSIKKTGILFCGAPIDESGIGEPDGWYGGVTHFSDRLWLFDTNNDVAQVLVEPKTVLGIDIDLTEPKLSPDEDYLVFINKTDLSLWALRLVDSK